MSCYNYLLGIESNLPWCFLRLDIAHLIKSICRWKCFEKSDCKVRDFYLRIIGYLSKVSDMNEFKLILKSVFIVCQSIGVDNYSEVEKNMKYLLDLIKFHKCRYCTEDCVCDFCIECKLDDNNFDSKNIIDNNQGEDESNLKVLKKKLQIYSRMHLIILLKMAAMSFIAQVL